MSGTGTGTRRGGTGAGTPVRPSIPLSTSDEIFLSALRDIYNSAVGADAVYAPLSGSSVSCRVILNRSVVLQPVSMETQVVEYGMTIEAILADLGRIPARGETFTIGAEIFTVQSISRNDGDEIELIVT